MLKIRIDHDDDAETHKEEIEKHKQDSLQQKKDGKAGWKKELASNSESAVRYPLIFWRGDGLADHFVGIDQSRPG